MAEVDAGFFDRALERIGRVMAALGFGGTLGLLVWRGWNWGVGFGFGALVSWLNYRWLKQVVDALGTGAVRRRVAVKAAGRYLLLGGGAYAILRFSKIAKLAALAGLFIAAAAVIVEIVFELLYAPRN